MVVSGFFHVVGLATSLSKVGPSAIALDLLDADEDGFSVPLTWTEDVGGIRSLSVGDELEAETLCLWVPDATFARLDDSELCSEIGAA